jgi:hypothetical protein
MLLHDPPVSRATLSLARLLLALLLALPVWDGGARSGAETGGGGWGIAAGDGRAIEAIDALPVAPAAARMLDRDERGGPDLRPPFRPRASGLSIPAPSLLAAVSLGTTSALRVRPLAERLPYHSTAPPAAGA